MSKANEPTQVALTVKGEFRALHSLEGFETPHLHVWKVSAEFSATLPLAGDRLIDLVKLQCVLDELLSPLQNSDLNLTLGLSPTSENLALWTWKALVKKIPDAPLSEVRIELCDAEGAATGMARVFR